MKKKSTKKVLLVVIAMFIAILAGAGFWIHNALFSYDPLVEKQILDQFGEDFFDFDWDLVLPPANDDDVIDQTNPPSGSDSAADPGTGTESNPAETTEPPEPTEPPAEDNDNDTAPQPPAPDPVTMESIVAKYETRLKALEAQALEKLDALFNAAVAEYQEQKEAGTLDKTALANKYIQAGQMLENSADAQFNALLSELESELAAHGFSTAITKEIKSVYNNAKTAKKREFLSKVGSI